MKLLRARDLYHLLVIVMTKVASCFPSPRLKELLATTIAHAAFHLQRNKRRRAERNLSKAFDGNLSKNERQRIVKESFCEFWEEVLSLLPSRGERRALQHIHVQGIEHLNSALENGRGAILWESRFGRRTLAKQALHQRGFSLHQIHHEEHLGGLFPGHGPMSWVQRHVIQRFFDNCERQFMADIIYMPSSGSLAFTRLFLHRLKENAILCSTGDGTFGQRLIPREFLGHIDPFPTGMVSLAKMSGAPILPMFCIRERGGQTRLIIEPPIRIETDVDRERGLEDSLAQYVHLLESYIRKYPAHYRDWHFLGKSYRTWQTGMGAIQKTELRPGRGQRGHT
jgi:lauroyl/myristoyl acyltransferase